MKRKKDLDLLKSEAKFQKWAIGLQKKARKGRAAELKEKGFL